LNDEHSGLAKTAVTRKVEMDREKVIRQFQNTVGKNSAKARSLIKKLDYKDPYLLQGIAQTYLDECLLYDDGRMREYVDKRKWRLAERYIIKAHILDNNDVDVFMGDGKGPQDKQTV
jgi:hypothetical protein